MRALLFGAVVGLVACKKDPAPAPVAAAPAPAVVPKRSALEAVPASQSVLSLFEPVKDGCDWKRVDPVAKTSAVVASFPGSCVGARVAWSKDGAKAAVWFDPKLVQTASIGGSEIGAPGYPDEAPDEKAKPRLFSVTPATGQAQALPLPAFALEDFGVGPAGEVLVLSLDEVDDAAVKAGTTTVDGEPFKLEPVEDGLVALAFAWRLERGAWARVETAQTTTGWDYGRGVGQLAVNETLGARSTELLRTLAGALDGPDAATLEKLKGLAPAVGEGDWAVLGPFGERAFVWTVMGEFPHTTGHLVFEAEPASKATGAGFTAGELVAVKREGPFVLLSSGHAGAHPRLYDARTKALLFSSDTARAATFWP